MKPYEQSSFALAAIVAPFDVDPASQHQPTCSSCSATGSASATRQKVNFRTCDHDSDAVEAIGRR